MKEVARLARNKQRLTECFGVFAKALKAVITDLEKAGFRPRIQDAWRSPEDQLKAFNSGNSKLKFGFHNVTGSNGEQESLAVDLLDDNSPTNPSTRYLLNLAAAAEAHGLSTGIRWGLPKKLRQGIDLAIKNKDFTSPVKVGWDPAHVEVTGLTPTEAKSGKRPK